MNEDFARELKELINKHSQENDSNTPDFILANFMSNCLEAWNEAVQQRENWYDRDKEPVEEPETIRRPEDV